MYGKGERFLLEECSLARDRECPPFFLPTAGTASANAGAPLAKSAMLTAPATVTMLLIIFLTGAFNGLNVHAWVMVTMVITRRKKRDVCIVLSKDRRDWKV